MILKEYFKKLANIRLIYLLPTLIALILLYFFILQLLYIKAPMLFDIGYWVGLSTNLNPLLIEPNVFSSNSYFFTHFSPIFIFLQLIFYLLPFKNPPLYFAIWYTFLTILPLMISIYYVFVRKNIFNVKENISDILFNLFLIITLIISYFTQFKSIYQYPHTEFIGMEYICTGWLILCILKSNEQNNIYNNSSLSKKLSFILIIFGSLFHELIALFGIVSLITINLNKVKDILFYLKSKSNRKQITSFPGIDDNHIKIIFFISSFLILWLILTNIIFKSNDQSALERIYLGSGDEFLSHLSLDYYLKNLINLLRLNRICFAYFTISYFLLSISDIKKIQNLFLPSILLFVYILFSPISRVSDSASILNGHYSYPLIFTFYFVLYSIFVIYEDKYFLKLIKKSSFKLILLFMILFGFQILRVYLPFEYEILTTDSKELNKNDFSLSTLDKGEERLLTKKGNLLLNLYKIPRNILDLIIISNNSNRILHDYYEKTIFDFNIIKKDNNLYLRQVLNHNWNNLKKRKTYIYKGTILQNNKKSAILVEKSEMKWIFSPINSYYRNYTYGKNTEQYLNINNKLYLNKLIEKNIDKESLKRFSENIKKENLVILFSDDFNKDGREEIYYVQRGHYDIFLKIILNPNGNISNLSYQSQDEVIKYLKANRYDNLIADLSSKLLYLKNKKLILNKAKYNNLDFNFEDIKISKNEIRPILKQDFIRKIDNSTLKRFKSNIENNNLLLLDSGDFNRDGLTEIYWKEEWGDTYLRMIINEYSDIIDLSYQSKDDMFNYLNKYYSKQLVNDLISTITYSHSKNQILDTETATLIPNISNTNLLAPYLFNENIKLKEGAFIYWSLTPEKNRDNNYINKVLNLSELKKTEYIQLGTYSGIPYYLRKYYYAKAIPQEQR